MVKSMESMCEEDFLRESPHVCPTSSRGIQGGNIRVPNPLCGPLTGPARSQMFVLCSWNAQWICAKCAIHNSKVKSS